jgi:anti-sigma factor RsiW
MSHLGRRLSALVDGELGDAERDQVHAHLVGCDECRAEAAALRTLKRRVRGLSETPADGDLTSRLIALAGLPEPAPSRSRGGATRARAALSAFSGGPAARPQASWDDMPEWFTGGLASDEVSPLAASPLASAPLGGQLAAARGRGHTRYVVAGAVAALAVGLGAASFAAGGGGHLPGPTITPQVDVYMLQHAGMSGTVPLGGSWPGTARP